MAASVGAFDWRAFSQKTWLIVVAGILFPPVGIVLAWLKPGWTARTKWIATGLMGLLFIGQMNSPGETPEKPGLESDEVVAGSTDAIVAADPPQTQDSERQPRDRTKKPAGSGSQIAANRLSAEYLPFKQGARANYDLRLNPTMMFHFHWDFKPGSVIEITHRSVSDGNGRHQYLNKPSGSYKYRATRSVVELGDETDGVGFVWQPLVKIGAKAGDSWESQRQHGVIHRYVLEEFGETQLTDPPLPSACISDHMSLDGEDVLTTQWYLAKGVGIVQKEVIVGATRSIMELQGRGLGSKSLTEAERKFFR